MAEQYAEGLVTEQELSLSHELADAAVLAWRSGELGGPVGIQAANAAASVAAPVDFLDASTEIWEATHELAKHRNRQMRRQKRKPHLKTGPKVRARQVQEAEAWTMQHDLLHCIFSNPFRPVSLDSVWLTRTVTMLAQAAYEERSLPAGTLDADRLAVLADALEDAGCTDATILEHLRGSGPHVRGCFVIDLILGKE